MTEITFPFEITEEPETELDRDERFVDEMEDVYKHVTTRKNPNLKKVERFFQKWKKYPETWNWYYTTLVKNNRKFEAEKLAKKTIEVFPDYIYGKCTYVRELISSEKIEEAIEFLGGETPDLLRWYPASKSFWYKDVLTYYFVFIDLELEKGNVNLAAEYLDQAVAAVPDGIEEKNLKQYQMEIVAARLEEFTKKKEQLDFREPEYKRPEKPEGYSLKPFIHSEIQELFDKTKYLKREFIDSILALPRETAISDLEQMLYRLLFEYSDEDYNRNEYYKLSYVLWFLYEFRAVESVEPVSWLLKMDGEDHEFWFADFYTNNTWFLFYILLENNPQPFLDILYEPNLNTRSKGVLTDAMEQIAWHNPEKREEVIGWLENLLNFYVENLDNEDVFDSEFAGLIEYTAMNLKAKSLLPQLKYLHEQNVMDEFMCGDYEEVEKGMDKEPVGGKDELPNIYSLAEKEAEFIQQFSMGDDEVNPYFKNQEEKTYNQSINNQETHENAPVKKTGRNEPCPCGSGKKYKKCCGA